MSIPPALEKPFSQQVCDHVPCSCRPKPPVSLLSLGTSLSGWQIRSGQAPTLSILWVGRREEEVGERGQLALPGDSAEIRVGDGIQNFFVLAGTAHKQQGRERGMLLPLPVIPLCSGPLLPL